MALTDTVLETFAECPIPPLEGPPTHTYLTDLNGYLNACAASVHCDLGNGTVGYLILTAQPATFLLACTTPFVHPTHPGATLTLPDPAPTSAVIGTLTRAHTEKLRLFNEYNSVDKSCKKILFSLIPEAYYRSFKNKYTGFANVTCLTILTHLWTTYGVLQDYEVQENDQMMKQPITAETLFEDFIEQIEIAVEAVASQVPYTDPQIVSIAFSLVETSGIYFDGAKEWRRKATADKTWANFKTFFAREFREGQAVSRSSQAGGYANFCAPMGQANAAVQEQMQENHTQALANLATATAADRQAVTTLTATNAQLTAELAIATATIATLQKKVAALSANRSNRRPRGGERGNQEPEVRPPIDPDGYCWTHGYRVSTAHNGYTCNNCAPGHIKEATRANPMGGSTLNKPE